jgi:nicotinate-nucleotide--dimethylbenzimidazole phosphoribosyltransferase
MVLNFLAGGAAINVLGRQAGARVVVADFGVASPLPSHSDLVRASMGPGTWNFSRGPAMSMEQARTCLESGIRIATDEIEAGADLIATGDMGIGNTTAASAITAAITGLDPMEVTGYGTGIDEAGRIRKAETIRRALILNRPDPDNALDVLAKVGGFEIGGLAGVILAGSARRVPVIVDGFISGAAALIACSLAPQARDYLVAAHRSAERGHAALLTHLSLAPLLSLGMRLGEGTGAVLAMHLVDAACRILNEMATFESAGVSGKSVPAPEKS